MKHSEKIQIENSTLEERGVPSDSYFEVTFDDDSVRHESDTSWSALSEEKVVVFLERQKIVSVSTLPVKKLRVVHGKLETTIEVKADEEVYQAIRSQAHHLSDNSTLNKVIGRVVGKVKDGKVIEERFLDERTGDIMGFRM